MSWYNWLVKFAGKVATAVANGTARDVAEYIKDLPKKVIEWWHGKKIAVIGPTAAGKNCLYRRLQNEPIPKEHLQTRGTERERFTFRSQLPNGQEFEIRCTRSANVGGETDDRERFWVEACDDADVIFYMMHLEDLRAGRYLHGQRIHDDLKWLVGILPQLRSNTVVHFLINKIDTELADGAKYEDFIAALKADVDRLEAEARLIFGPYKNRLTGISPTSMMDDHIFAVSFPLALEAVHGAVMRKKPSTVGTSS